jgi:hypothetical protein
METKLIAMILGVALVLATATVYTQSVFAIPIGSGGAGVIGTGGNGGTGGVGDVCLSCFVGGSNGGQTAHDISALRAGIAGAIHEQFVATATFQGGGPHTTAHGLGSLRAGIASDISALRAGIAGVIGGGNGGNGGVGSTGPGDSIINNNNLGFSPGFGGGWQRAR